MSHDTHTKHSEQGSESLEESAPQNINAPLAREADDLQESSSPMPILVLMILVVLGVFGWFYLKNTTGGYRWDAYSPDFDPDAVIAAPVAKPLAEVGAKIFKNQCSACHQGTGLGLPGVYPPLAGSEWVTGHEEALARILINGLNGPIEVAGNTFNGNMPAFGPSGMNLKPREIAGVLTYIRQEWGNSAAEVTEESIDTYLESYSARGTPWTAGELNEDLSE